MPRMDIAALRAAAPAGRALGPALRRRRRARRVLRARRPRRAALPRDRPVGRALHRARVRRAARAERRRRLRRGRGAGRRGARARPATPAALAAELGRLLAEPGGARRAGRGRAPRGGRALLVGRDRAPTSRPLRGARSTMGAVTTVLEVVFWSCVVLLAYAQVGYPLLLAALARRQAPARGQPAPPARAAGRAAEREPHRRGLRRGRRHRREGRKRARARLPARPPRGHRRQRRLRRRHGVRGAPRGRRPRARPAARRQDPRAGLGGRAGARRAARLQRRELDLGARRAAHARRGVRRRDASATPAGRCSSSSQGGTNQEGLYWRYEMALRSLESKLGSITAGNGAIYATRRDSYIKVDPVMGHDLSFPFNMVKRGWRAVYVPGGARDGEDGAVDRGRVRPQAADDEPRLADRPARRPAVAARLPAAVRAHDRLASRPALRRAVPARRRVRRERGAGSASSAVYAVAFGAAARAARGGAARRRVRFRPLLVARYYVLTTASVAAGLWDHLRHGTPAGWEPADGTR